LEEDAKGDSSLYQLENALQTRIRVYESFAKQLLPNLQSFREFRRIEAWLRKCLHKVQRSSGIQFSADMNHELTRYLQCTSKCMQRWANIVNDYSVTRHHGSSLVTDDELREGIDYKSIGTENPLQAYFSTSTAFESTVILAYQCNGKEPKPIQVTKAREECNNREIESRVTSLEN
jgi:hypothetical protein